MYVDTSADARICLNAANADTTTKLATSRTITIGGAVTGSMKFDGSSDITITTSVNHTHSYAGSASAGGDANRAVKVKDSTNGKDITITYGKAAQTSTSWLASWNGYELGTISPANITAGKATQLATARTITLGTAVTSTATTFNGSSNITIPITGVKEKYLTWGGKNVVGDVAPIDAAMSYLHNANRAQFAKPAGITIQYSTDGGSTWLDYGATDQQKIQFVSGLTESAFYLGKQISGTGLINNQLRIIINASACNFYTRLKTVLIYISTKGDTNLTCQIDKAMRGSESTFLSTPVGTYTLSGWSGWNSIPFDILFGGNQYQTSNIGALRFTFKYAAAPATNQNANIIEMMFLGTTAWTVNSNMANTGHLYAWDYAQNAAFPAQISATKFNGSATSADTATQLTNAKTISLAGDITATGVAFNGTSNITLTTAMNINYAGSASKGGPAAAVATSGAATANSARHVWFSDSSTETQRVHDDNFKYNPSTNTLTANVTGSSASCTGNAATATKLQTSRTIALSGDVTGSVSFNGSANVTIASTLAANYAGSSSKGGAATSANKLNTNAGSATLPVYFTGGVPKAINTTGVGISITGNAATATKLATPCKIGDASFDGSANIALSTMGAQPAGDYFKGTKDSNGYWGLNTPDGSTSNFIRTSSSGLIPYQSGNIGNGHNSLGTKTWYFANTYVDNTHTKVVEFNDGSANITYDTTNQCITFNFS